MLFAVGSTRGPKVEAVRRVLAQLGPRAPQIAQAEAVAVDVTAGTPPMPLTIDELLDGPPARAHLSPYDRGFQAPPDDVAGAREGRVHLLRRHTLGLRGSRQ